MVGEKFMGALSLIETRLIWWTMEKSMVCLPLLECRGAIAHFATVFRFVEAVAVPALLQSRLNAHYVQIILACAY